jgi:hypothetical protein
MCYKLFLKQYFEKIVAICFGMIVGIEQRVYWSSAIAVSKHATMYGEESYWRSGGAGTFFPWPKEHGMLTVKTPMNPVDSFIYIHLIETNLFIVVAVGITLFFALIGWCVGEFFKKKIFRQ